MGLCEEHVSWHTCGGTLFSPLIMWVKEHLEVSGSDFTYWVDCHPLLKSFRQSSLHAESQTPHAFPLAVFVNPCQQHLALQASEGHCGLVYWTWLTGTPLNL